MARRRGFPSFLERFLLDTPTCKGDFCTVFTAIDCLTNNFACVKIQKEEKNTAISNEFQVLKKLSDIKGIPKVKGYFIEAKKCIIVTNLCGQNLYYLNNESKFNWPFTIISKIGIQLIMILKNLHEHGYIHRNIKPSNICLGFKDD